MRRSHQESLDSPSCLMAVSISSKQPARKALTASNPTTTHALRAIIRPGSKTPVSAAGGATQCGTDGNREDGASSSSGHGSKNTSPRYDGKPAHRLPRRDIQRPHPDRPGSGSPNGHP